MGMTIDEHIEQIKKLKSFHNGSYGASINYAIETMRKYQMMQADYENRLKADMVAMFTDIQLEIEEKKFLESSCSFMDKTEEKNYAVYTDDISKVIQQKIDALKADVEPVGSEG